MSQQIKTIIFDNNGVLTSQGKEGGYKKIAEFLEIEYEVFLLFWSEIAKPLDDGILTTEEFYDKIFERAGKAKDLKVLRVLHEASYKKRKDVHDFVAGLKENYELALLSNFGDAFDEFNRSWELDKIFEPEKMFVSCKLKMKKPGKEIYLHALDKLGRSPEEVVFIDDREENVATARSLGMHAIRYESLEKLEKDLEKYTHVYSGDHVGSTQS